jgi:hypothetical protein
MDQNPTNTDLVFADLVAGFSDDSTNARTIPTPERVLPGLDNALAVPPGYALRTRRITHPDGRVEEISEPVAQPAVDTPAPAQARFGGMAEASYAMSVQQQAGAASDRGQRALPDWVTTNTAKRKAAIAAAGIGAATIIYCLYGDAIGASISHGLHQAWAFAAHVAGVVAGVGVLAGVVYFLLRPAGSRRPREGWFEGKISGRWGED